MISPWRPAARSVSKQEVPVVSLFAFVMTAYGMNPYLIASFNSGFACENARTQIIAVTLDPSVTGAGTHSVAARNLKCLSTPGLVAGGIRPPEPIAPPKPSTVVPAKAGAAPPPPSKKPAPPAPVKK
jgi:hypothetical protein